MFKFLKIFIISLLILFLLFLYFAKVPNYFPKNMDQEMPDDYFGVTFSKKYSEELGLDWKEVYIATLDDLNVKHIRLAVYWDDIEKSSGVFDYSDYIYMIEEGEKRGIDFVLSFGMRVPRWPECHIPYWLDINDIDFLQERTFLMLEETVKQFKDYNSIKYWQVENEPLLNTFGICPKADYAFLKKEVELVRSLDDRPIIISATGELSLWKREIDLADVFGTTMYRIVHNPYLSYIKYPYSSSFYRNKALFLKANLEDVFIVELQAEPWASLDDIRDIESQEYLKSFSLGQFRANTQFAVNTGFKRAYLWGVEWWYFRHVKANDSSYWDFSKNLFKENGL